MKTTKIIRYFGFGLLILSTVLLLYLFSFSILKDTKARSTDQYAVLEIAADSTKFPQTDFDALFSKLNLVSSSVQIDAGAPAAEQEEQIAAAARETGSDHIILFARKDACMPALSAALSQAGITSVILLSPTQDVNGNADSFGTYQPDLPVAVFDADTKYSTSLYERLSGEDATLFPGFKDDGKMPAEVFISPDGSRYLSKWNLSGNTAADQSILPFLPQVQIKIGEYISTYVFDPSVIPTADSRSQVGTVHIVKTLAAAFLAAGLLMFFASIPKSRRETEQAVTKAAQAESMAGASAAEATAPSALRGGLSESTSPAVIERARARAFLLSLLISVLFSAGTIALYLSGRQFAPDILGSWPVLYYASCAVFLFRFFPKTISSGRIPFRRLVFSGFLAFFFITGIFLFTVMNSPLIGNTFTGLHGILLAGVFLFLLILSWVRMSADEQSYSEKFRQNSRTGARSGWYQNIPLILPYAAVLILLLVQRRTVLCFQSLYLLTGLLAGIWVRSVFRRTSGTEWLAAAAFAAFYSLIAFA